MSSSSRLKKIATIIPVRNYLEIGVQEGRTFLGLEFQNQVAVEPLFRFNYKSYALDRHVLFEEESDKFFQEECRVTSI